jgi:hypothetical protein
MSAAVDFLRQISRQALSALYRGPVSGNERNKKGLKTAIKATLNPV